MLAADDQPARNVRLLSRKGVVSAHRIERPFAARLDETERVDRGAMFRRRSWCFARDRERCG
jgi:hypothetical protein